jgi:predicted RNA binding protein YcfA (HicA-like mRNA interferase family)
MPKLPCISGKELVKILVRNGFDLVSQRGSHMKLRKDGIIVIVPNHKELRQGTLRSIIKITNIGINEL